MTRQEAARLIEELFSTWYPCLFRYLLRWAGSRELAEDIAQEAFVELYRQLARGREVGNLQAWTLCVARRQLERWLRREAHGPLAQSLHVVELAPARIPPWEAAELGEITRLFAGLSRREEETLLLRLEGLKYREIAARLGISANSVSTHLVRALKKLRVQVGAGVEARPLARIVPRRARNAY